VESLTAKDVAGFVADAIKGTPTLVSYGSMASAPRLSGKGVMKRLA
jgi:hypothetical protein